MQTISFVASLITRRRAVALLLLVVLGSLAVLDLPVLAADAPKPSWSGTWNNKKFKTTGPLTCTVIGEQNGQWIAKFTGTGMGNSFSYTAYITPKGSGATTNLQGVAKVDGDSYQWAGSITGQTMVGSFRSGSGNNGDFRLQGKK